MIFALAAHIAACKSPHLLVNQWDELSGSFLTSVRQVSQKGGYFARRRVHLGTAHCLSRPVCWPHSIPAHPCSQPLSEGAKTPITYCTFTRLKRDFLSV